MSDPNATQGGGVVEQLARDDVERKRFLKMAGKTMGSGAAAGGLAPQLRPQELGSAHVSSAARPATN
jgi:hypothetical protein